MELIKQKNNVYKLVDGTNEIQLSSYEILELAQQVIDDQYSRIHFNLEDTLINRDKNIDAIVSDYEIISPEEAKEFELAGETIFYYSAEKEEIIPVPPNANYEQYSELYAEK